MIQMRANIRLRIKPELLQSDTKTRSAVAITFERISIWRIYQPFGIALSFKQTYKKKSRVILHVSMPVFTINICWYVQYSCMHIFTSILEQRHQIFNTPKAIGIFLTKALITRNKIHVDNVNILYVYLILNHFQAPILTQHTKTDPME